MQHVKAFDFESARAVCKGDEVGGFAGAAKAAITASTRVGGFLRFYDGNFYGKAFLNVGLRSDLANYRL